MDGLTRYEEFPVTARSIDREGVERNCRLLKEIIKVAHSVGKPVYYWHREAMVPDGLLDDRPGLLDSNGEFDLLGDEYAALLRYKIDSSFKNVPELDGLVLTLTEASYGVIHNSNTEKYPPKKVVEHIVRIFASELAARRKHFVLRSFGSIAQDYEDIIDGARPVAQEYGFEIETKITPYDFDPFLQVNPFLRSVPGATLGAECDCLGEFLGAGLLPAENVDNIVRYVRAGQAAGVNRYAIRLDRVGNDVFDRYEINLYAYARAIDDPDVTAYDIRREWYAAHAPESARETFCKLGIDGFEMICKNNFIDGNVIFHNFPLRKDLKYIKAAFILALFKNGVDLHNGEGVWSILFDRKTPGRDAIIREKQEAVAIADRSAAALAALPVEPGFENEYAWRKKLWDNAKVVTRAFLSFARCVCAYFDDMEKGDPEAASLHRETAEARKVLQSLASVQLSLADENVKSYVNGLEKHLFNADSSLDDIYLQPLYIVTRLFEEEYAVEFAARQKFSAGAVDAVLCGSILDEWRVARYMHGANVSINDGYQYRWAGNTVFPNGFLGIELAKDSAGGVLEIYGDISETASFCCSVDGGVKEVMEFDGDGRCVLPLAPGGERVKVRLEKAPGSFYPRFRAVVVKK